MGNIDCSNKLGTYIHREPMTSDVVFKAVFGQDTKDSKSALIELLNVVLEYEDDPIVDIVYKNPFSISEVLTEKVIIMDVKVETDKGAFVDIEMQIGELDEYINRSIYYGCNQLAKSLDKGDTYDKIKKSIVISFVKNRIFPKEKQVHSVFTLRENNIDKQLSSLLELHYIELGKINCSERDPEKLSPLEQLGAYFLYSGSVDDYGFVEVLVQKGAKVISMADKVLKKVSEEERLQYLRESRQMAEMQLSWEKQAAREKGLAEGRAEGREKGLAEGRAEGRAEGLSEGARKEKLSIARNLKDDGVPIAVIVKNTGLTTEEVEKL